MFHDLTRKWNRKNNQAHDIDSFVKHSGYILFELPHQKRVAVLCITFILPVETNL